MSQGGRPSRPRVAPRDDVAADRAGRPHLVAGLGGRRPVGSRHALRALPGPGAPRLHEAAPAASPPTCCCPLRVVVVTAGVVLAVVHVPVHAGARGRDRAPRTPLHAFCSTPTVRRLDLRPADRAAARRALPVPRARLDLGMIDGLVNATGRAVVAWAAGFAPAADRLRRELRAHHAGRRRPPRRLPADAMTIGLLTRRDLPAGAGRAPAPAGAARPRGRAADGALGVALATFAVSLPLYLRFDAASADYQFEEFARWMPALGVSYHVGIDGISLLLVLLTTLPHPHRARLRVARHRGAQRRSSSITILAPGDGDDRRVREPRPLPLLRVLGGDADPDVLHDRRVGRRATASTRR